MLRTHDSCTHTSVSIEKKMLENTQVYTESKQKEKTNGKRVENARWHLDVNGKQTTEKPREKEYTCKILKALKKRRKKELLPL
jgi:hypothetical protein